MSKITYANKQTAVDPNNPAPNEIFYATDANEVKASVNDLYDRLDNITLIDGFVSGPTLIATSSTNVAVQTFTQNVALIYNANNFQYTRNAGAADLTFTATPDATFDKGCIIQANGTTISLKQGVAAANVIYPTPDTGYVQIYSFIISTTGISSILDSLGSYLELNNLNSGNVVIDGFYKQQGIISKVLKTASDGTFVGIDGTSAQYIKGDGSLGTLSTDAVTSVGLTMPSAFQVSGSPITTSGTIAVQGAGNATQYIAGDGTLVTFPVAGQAGTLVTEVRNVSGATMTKGTIVYINGANANKPTIAKALATSDATSARTLGFLQTDISNNSNGYCVIIGLLTGLNTTAFTEGTQLYLSGLTAGAYTSTKSLAPTHLVYVGKVTRSHATLGQIEVGIQNGFELEELHDVAIASPLQGHGIFWNEALSLWMNSSIAVALGYTPIGGSGTTNYLPKFTGTTSIGNSLIYDNGTNVGIGTTTSYNSAKLSINGEGISIWRIRTIAGGELPLAIGSQSVTNETIGLAGMYHVEYGSGGFGQSGGLIFKTSANDSAPTERMRIHGQSGNLGIGTTSPQSLLHVNGVITFGGDTRYGVSKIYDANTGDGFGLEQVSAAQSGLAGAGTRLFTANGGSNFISLGKYTTATAFTSWLHITQAGNIGIGTTASVRRLEVASDGSNWITGTFSGSGGTDKVVIGNLGNIATIGGHTSALTAWSDIAIGGVNIIFAPYGSEKMRLNSSGNLGIGYTAPTQKLDVNGNIKADGYISAFNNAGLTQTINILDDNGFVNVFGFENGLLVAFEVI